MIEVTFGESPAGALKLAKSMKHGQSSDGPVAIFGGSKRERREALQQARTWNGQTMDGSAHDVTALTLAMCCVHYSKRIWM